MTENSRMVFEYLKKHPDKQFSKQQLIDLTDLSMPAVNASILNFINKGFVQEFSVIDPATANFVNPLYHKTYQITETGLAFDPDEEELRQKRERLVRRAANREAREREKAERARANFVS